MKKTILFLLLTVLLTAGMMPASGDEAVRPVGMMDLFTVIEGESVWLGTAVPVYDGILVSSAAILPDGLSQLMITDGTSVWNAEAAMPDNAGMLMTVLYDDSKAAPAFAPLTFTSLRGVPGVSDLNILTGDENISRMNRKVYSVLPITWNGTACMLVAASGQVELGSPLLTNEGGLVGVAVAKWAEGTNRVVFISTEGMNQSIAESLDRLFGEKDPNPPEGFKVTVEGNVVTFNWYAMTMPETGEGEKLYLVVSDVMNRYLTYVSIEDETHYSMTLTPGRTYQAGIIASAEGPDRVPVEYASITLPPAEKLTEYGFVSRECAIAEAPEGGLKGDELPKPVEKVTEELLRSGRAYFYSSTTYEVTTTKVNISLLVTLTDPEGNNYRYESSWVYDPSYMNDDTWAVSLQDAGLVDMLNELGYPEGTYQVDMYIGGALADSFTFDLP